MAKNNNNKKKGEKNNNRDKSNGGKPNMSECPDRRGAQIEGK